MRTSADGSQTGGRPFSRGHIYRILKNPIYIGRIPHKGEVYEGQNQTIVDQDTWDTWRASERVLRMSAYGY